MPFYKKLSLNNADIYLWNLAESPQELLALLPSNRNYADEITRFRSVQRQREWLSTRVLLHTVLGHDVFIAYDEVGAPFLQRRSPNKMEISHALPAVSISHSRQWIALAVAHADVTIGIDLETISERADRVIHKFLSSAEQQLLSCSHSATHLWCAKEATYKLCHHKGLRFLGDMQLTIESDTLQMQLPRLRRTALLQLGTFEDTAFALASFLL